MFYQCVGRFTNGVQGCDRAVGPQLQHQPFVVGDLTDSGTLDGVVHLADWIEYGVNGQNPKVVFGDAPYSIAKIAIVTAVSVLGIVGILALLFNALFS